MSELQVCYRRSNIIKQYQNKGMESCYIATSWHSDRKYYIFVTINEEKYT